MADSRVAFDLQIPSDVEYIEGVVELATHSCRELKLLTSQMLAEHSGSPHRGAI